MTAPHSGFRPGTGGSSGFREDQHPRGPKGEFTDKGAGAAAEADKGAAARPALASRGREGFTDITADAARREMLGVSKEFTDVHAADDPESDLTWVARNAAGDPVSKYSAAHTARQRQAKYARQRDFVGVKPLIDAQIDRDFRKGREEAAVLRLISLSGFRNGGEEGESQVKGQPKGVRAKTYGANTLEKQHVRVEGDVAHFDFIDKSGIRQQHAIEDAELAGDMRTRLETRPGNNLFDSNDTKVLKYMRSLEGAERPGDEDPYRIHDFRTHAANTAALAEMARQAAPTNAAEYWAAYDAVGAAAGRKIGDEPKTALLHYVDPMIFVDWQHQAGVGPDDVHPPKPRTKKAKGT